VRLDHNNASSEGGTDSQFTIKERAGRRKGKMLSFLAHIISLSYKFLTKTELADLAHVLFVDKRYHDEKVV
jgi:hypothetical protein